MNQLSDNFDIVEDVLWQWEFLNITLVSEEFPPFTPWWIATYQKTLSRMLSQRPEIGGVTVVCKADGEMPEGVSNEDGVRVVRIKPYFQSIPFLSETVWYKLKVARTLLKERKISKIDVIESPEWNQELFFYFIYNLLTLNSSENDKIAIRLHTPLFVTKRLNKLASSVRNEVNILMERFLIWRAQTVTSCSQSLIEEVKKHGIVRDDIQVVHNPGNSELFDKDRDFEDIFQLRQEEVINILFSGSLEERKWIVSFCKSAAKLLQLNPNTQVIFCWKFWWSDNANSKLSKEEVLSYFQDCVRDRVVFLGLVPYEKMPNVYKHVDICIYPSLYDNYPWVVIESLLMWKAVIASQNTGIKEAVKEWIIYIAPEDVEWIFFEAQWLIDNRERRDELWNRWFSSVNSLNSDIMSDFIWYYSRVKKLNVTN